MIARPDQASVLEETFGVVTGAPDPKRLSRTTRTLAARVLAGKWGAAMRTVPPSAQTDKTNEQSPLDRYVDAIRFVAREAPLRVEPDELLVGAATFLEAARHCIPACEIRSVSHTTVGFEHVLDIGYLGLKEQIGGRLQNQGLDAEVRETLLAMRSCLDAAATWHARYVSELEDLVTSTRGEQRGHYQAVLDHLRGVPARQPSNFREAVQSLWLMWDFLRLCGNWSGVGRIDKILGPYLKRDLDNGVLTLDEARELLAHFWIKGCEWIGADSGHVGTTGDAQFYQNVVLSGMDEGGRDITNEVTYLVLDVVEELHISDFPIAVRIGPHTPERLLRRIAEVQRRGGGIVAIYNEPLILKALERFGYDRHEARDFANDGCWEIIMPGKTFFRYRPFDMLRLLQNVLGLGPDSVTSPNVEDFEELYALFRQQLETHLAQFHAGADHAPESDRAQPAPLVALFVQDCIARGRDYHKRGPRFTVDAPHAGGIPDAANSLLAIRKLVFEQQRFTLAEFVDILRADWKDQELLRREVRQSCSLYGNDDTDADAMVRRIYNDFVELAGAVKVRSGVLRPPGISTFGREIGYREYRQATAFGARKGEILSRNFGPTPGTDMQGPTALMRSFCSMDFSRLPNGAPMELKIDTASVKGESGIDVLVALMRTFVQLGGIFLHIDVVDTEVLRDAQEHPERYPNLSVRISGWSARFATLSAEWQDAIIQRTEHRI